jgi:farnesyl diphosphate synthase
MGYSLMTTATADFAKRLDQTGGGHRSPAGEAVVRYALPTKSRPKRLMDAMRYSSLGGGKRLRPFWWSKVRPCSASARGGLLVGAALECIIAIR